MIGHGSLTPSALSPMGTRVFALPLLILVMTSEHSLPGQACLGEIIAIHNTLSWLNILKIAFLFLRTYRYISVRYVVSQSYIQMVC